MQTSGIRHLFVAKSPEALARLRAAKGKQFATTTTNLSLASVSRLERGFTVTERTAESYRRLVAPDLAFGDIFDLSRERAAPLNFTWEQVSRAATVVGRKALRQFQPSFLITFAGPSSLFTSLVMAKTLSREEFLKMTVYLAIFRDRRRPISVAERRGFDIVETHRFNLRIPVAIARTKNRGSLRIAVIDDTVTTGSSLDKLTQYLVQHGFRRNNILFATFACSGEALQEQKTRPDVWVHKTNGPYRLPWGPPL